MRRVIPEPLPIHDAARRCCQPNLQRADTEIEVSEGMIHRGHSLLRIHARAQVLVTPPSRVLAVLELREAVEPPPDAADRTLCQQHALLEIRH